MHNGEPCPRCASSKTIGCARLFDHAHYTTGCLEAGIQTEEKGFFGSSRRTSTALWASICGSCGFVEVHVHDPGEFYDAFTKAAADASADDEKPSA